MFLANISHYCILAGGAGREEGQEREEKAGLG